MLSCARAFMSPTRLRRLPFDRDDFERPLPHNVFFEAPARLKRPCPIPSATNLHIALSAFLSKGITAREGNQQDS